MTRNNVVPFDVTKKRADRRLEKRVAGVEKARRKLLPVVVIVCETFHVSADDLIDPQNRHPVVMMARDIARWIGYHRLHIGVSVLDAALGQNGTKSRDVIGRIEKKLATKPAFKRQLECAEKLYEAQVSK